MFRKNNKIIINKKIDRADKIAAWRLCMGCGACKWACPNQAISLKDIIDKGIRPFVDDSKCEKCGKCVEVCPGVSLEHKQFPDGVIEQLKNGWGPILEIHEGYACDENIRFAGSSGGVATALALYAIEQAGFKGVLHIKVSPDNPIENIPTFSTSRDEILRTTGSRYAPAAPCQGFDYIKNAHGKCMFIGKPCDCAALRKACEMDTELAANVGLVVSIFCAGTPSTAGTVAVLKAMGIDDLKDVKTFKYRGEGWPGMAKVETARPLAAESLGGNVIINQDGSREMTYAETWGRILSKHGQLRCRLCPDSTGEFADIAVGDPWYRDTTGDLGRSLILVRTVCGIEFVNNCVGNQIDIQPANWSILPQSQKSVYERRCQIWGRLLITKSLSIPYPRYCGFVLIKQWKTSSFRNKYITLGGTLKRCFVKKWLYPECYQDSRGNE